MSDGVRSLLAPWIGGASDSTLVGFRSFTAFWMGGASSFRPIVVSTGRDVFPWKLAGCNRLMGR